MADSSPQPPLPFRKIFHPTDFSAESAVAFAHALKLALVAQAEFEIMHVDPAVSRQDFEDFPHIRPILARWGILPEGSSKEQVAALGVTIKKIRAIADNPTTAISQHLTLHPTDLVVLSTHQYEGIERLRHHAVAEPIARAARSNTLFLPSLVEGFVGADSGQGKLRRILIPVSQTPHPQPAVDIAAALAAGLGSDKGSLQLVHAGSEEDIPKINKPQLAGWTWDQVVGQADVVDWILAAGAGYDVDLIVMMTEGHNSILDMLRGSVTERVLRGARCPVLAIPLERRKADPLAPPNLPHGERRQ